MKSTQPIKVCGLTASQILEMRAANKRMAAELIELKNINSGQDQFLDALENLLLDHGYKLVDAHE